MHTIKEFKSITDFSTDRLHAKKIESNDLDKFIQMDTNSEVMKTLGGVCAIEKTQEKMAWNLQQWQENGFGIWFFYLKDTDQWIGRGGVRRVNVNNKEEIEIAYALLPQYWQQGYATEIAQASCEIAFEILKLKNIVCFTLTTNAASRRVMEKIGFKYESDFIHYENPHVLYRMSN